MTAFANGKIEAYLGPGELGAADDLEAVIVDFIESSRSTLDIAVQELDNQRIGQERFVDASWRGVDVDLFLEQDYQRRPLPGQRSSVLFAP